MAINKELLKSVISVGGGATKTAAKFVFEPIMPVTVNTISNAAQTTREMRSAYLARRAQKRASQNQNRTDQSNLRKANEIFQKSMTDLQNGEFSVDKVKDNLYSDFENDIDDAFEVPTGDEAADMSPEEITLLGNRGIAQAVVKSAEAQLEGLESISSKFTSVSIRNSQAMTQAITAQLSMGFNETLSLLTITNSKLDMINENLANLLDFHNEYTGQFYEMATDLMGQMFNSIDALQPKDRKKGRKFDLSRGFSARNYLDYVKEGLFEGLSGAFMGGNGPQYRQRWKTKDLSTGNIIADMVLEKILPEKTRGRMKRFDSTVELVISETMTRLGESIENYKGDNSFMKFLSSAFKNLGLSSVIGNGREKLNFLNMGKYEKGPMPWNGVAQKYLTEVIPEYLASIDAGINKRDKRYYDNQSGKFRTETAIRDSFRSEIQDAFSLEMQDAFQGLRESMKGTGITGAQYNKLISEINKSLNSRLSNRTNARQFSGQMRQAFSDVNLEGSTAYTNFMIELEKSLPRAVEAMNDALHQMEQTQSIYRTVNNGADGRKMNMYDTFRTKLYNGKVDFSRPIAIKDPVKEIHRLQDKCGQNRSKIDLADPKWRNEAAALLNAIADGAPEYQLYTFCDEAYSGCIAKMAAEEEAKNKAEERARAAHAKRVARIDEYNARVLRTHRGQIRNYGTLVNPATRQVEYYEGYQTDMQRRMQNFVNAADNAMDRAEQYAYQRIFTGEPPIGHGRSFRYTPLGYGPGAATSRMKGGAKVINVKAHKANDQLVQEATQGTAALQLNQDQLQNQMQKDAMILRTAMSGEAPTTVEQSIIDSNNSVKGAMGFIVSSFQKFGSMIFGKEGILRKFWDSDLRKKITGRLFTDEDALFGDEYQAVKNWAQDTWQDTKDYAKEKFSKAYDTMMTSLYGENYMTSERYQNSLFAKRPDLKSLNREKIGDAIHIAKEDVKDAVIAAGSTVTEAGKEVAEQFKEAGRVVVGSFDESKPEEERKELKSKWAQELRKQAPRVLVGGAGGALLGTLNMANPSLLGLFLPGGPIAGAIVGSGLGIISQTETFKKFMYGELNEETGQREGGLISQQMRDKFKSALPMIGAGAALGALKGLLKGALGFHGGLGIMGMQLLPGGILGGAILGAGLSLAKNTETFKTLMYGKLNKDTGEREGKSISASWNKLKDRLGAGIKGVGFGGLTAGVIGNMGLLGAALTPGGVIGGALIGLGMGIASTTDKFKEWMFGTEIKDENGNVTGRNKDGFLQRMANTLKVNMVEPIVDKFREKMEDMLDWSREKIIGPISLLFGPVQDSLGGLKDSIVEMIDTKLENFGNWFKDLAERSLQPIIKPLVSFAGKLGKGILSATAAGAKMALAPLSWGAQLLPQIFSKKVRENNKAYLWDKDENGKTQRDRDLEAYWAAEEAAGRGRNAFQKFNDRLDSRFHTSAFRIRVGNESAKKSRMEDRRTWRQVDKVRRNLIKKDFKGAERDLSDSELEMYRQKFGGIAGFDASKIRSSKDLMNLLYRKGTFKETMNIDPQATTEEKMEQNTVEIKTDVGEIKQDLAGTVQILTSDGSGGIVTRIGATMSDVNEALRQTIIEQMENLNNTLIMLKEGQEKHDEEENDYWDMMEEYSEELAQNTAEEAEAKRRAEQSAGTKARRERENAEDEVIDGKLGKEDGSVTLLDKFKGFFKRKKKGEGEEEVPEDTSTKKGGLKNAIKKFFSGKVGRVVKKGILLSGLSIIGVGIANLLAPGLHESVMNGIGNLSDFITMINEYFKNPKQLGHKIALKIEMGTAVFFDKIFGKLAPEGSWFREKVLKPVGEGYRKFVDKAFEIAPQIIPKIGDFLKTNFNRLVEVGRSVITELGPPLIKLALNMTWPLMKAMFTALTDVGRDLFHNMIEKIKEWIIPGYKAKTIDVEQDISDAKVQQIMNAGENVRTSTTSFTSEADAQRYVEENNLENAIVTRNAQTQQYDVATNSYMADSRGAYDENGNVVAVRSNAGGTVLKTAGRMMLDPKFATAMGKSTWLLRKGVQVTARATQGATAILGKIPVIGLPAKAVSATSGVVADVAKDGSVFTTIMKKFKGLIGKLKDSKVLTKLLNKSGVSGNAERTFLGKAVDWIDDVIEKAIQKFPKLNAATRAKAEAAAGEGAAKVSGKTFAVALKIGFAVYGAIEGAVDAPHLFGLPDNECTGTMRAAAAIIQTICNATAVGGVFEVLSLVISIITNGETDMKRDFAVMIYKLLNSIIKADVENQLEISQENLETERQIYNAINGTNLDDNAYNDLRNKTMWQKVGDWWNGLWGKPVAADASGTSDMRAKLNQMGYSNDQIASMTQDQIRSALGYGKGSVTPALGYGVGDSTEDTRKSWLNHLASEYNKLSFTPSKPDKYATLYTVNESVLKIYDLLKRIYGFLIARERYSETGRSGVVGYGGGQSTSASNYYSQNNPNYKDMKLGRFSNGKTAYFGDAGCGPTALSAVYNQAMGYGPMSPADMGRYLSSTGGISNGGLNAYGATVGAARLGLRSQPIANTSGLASALASGRPVMLSGHSSGGSDPYTRAGHVVVANNLYGDKTSVLDTATGKRKYISINNLARHTDHAWAYSRALGYGPDDEVGYDYVHNPDQFIREYQKVKMDIDNWTARNAFATRWGFKDYSSAMQAAEKLIQERNAKEVTQYREERDRDSSLKTACMNLKSLRTIYDDPKRLSPYGPKLTINLNGNNQQTVTVTDEFYVKRRDELLSEIKSYVNAGGKIPSEFEALVNALHAEKYGKPLTDTGVTVNTSSTTLAKTKGFPKEAIVSVTSAEVKSGPNDWSATNGHIAQDTAVILTGESGTFYMIDSTHWIRKSSVKTFDADSKSSGETGVVNRETAKVYQTPEPTAIIVDRLRKGAVVSILGRIKGFYKIGTGRFMNMEDVDVKSDPKESGETPEESVLSDLASQTYDLSNPAGISAYASTLGFLGKLKLIGQIISAKYNSMINGTDFWSEMANASQSTGTVLKGNYTGRDGVVTNLSGTDRDRYVAMAQSQIGYKEKINTQNLVDFEANAGGSDYTKYAQEMLGTNGLAWCAAFAAWNGKAAGIPSDVIWQKGNFASCTSVMKHAKENGTWRYRDEYIPESGDQILFNWGGVENPKSCDTCNHIGIVEYVQNGKVYTIEGNSKNQVRRKVYDLNSKYIVGYVHPNWTGTTQTVNPSELLSLGYGNTKNREIGRTDIPVSTLSRLRKRGVIPLGYGPDDEDIARNKERISRLNSGISTITSALTNYLGDKIGLDLGSIGINTGNTSGSTMSISGLDTNIQLSLGSEQQKIWNYLGSKGLNPYARAGIMGTWQAESSNVAKRVEGDYLNAFKNMGGYDMVKTRSQLNNYVSTILHPALKKTAARQGWKLNTGAYKGSDGNLYPGLGLAQWTGPRAEKLLAAADQYGKPWYELEPQLALFSKEMEERGLFNKLSGVTNTNDATRIFARDFEGTTIDSWVQKRQGYARDIYSQLGYGNGPKFNSDIKLHPMDIEMHRNDARSDTTDTLKDLGFGPGMNVNASVDTASTDGRLDKIFEVLHDWYVDTKKTGAAKSTDTKEKSNQTSNMFVNNVRNVQNQITPTPTPNGGTAYREKLINQHLNLSSRVR